MATNVGLHLKPRDLGYRCLVSEAWYHFAPHLGCQKQAGKQDSNMMVRRDRNIPSKFKDPGVWTFRITCAAKVLKLQKETKNWHQLESTEIRFPLGQRASISGWSGPEGLLSFNSVLTQVLPETWVAVRATLWGSKPPAHCETADTTISEQKQKQQACGPCLWTAQFPPKESY